ncbi:hypothetical protein ACIQGZ_19410 [Streptomyces sp. NPDC092296]|uniref:hypothetical protein n=1 Tax=Streptomyces sp. NPDC092296 TaxID=3366012 RepID=UPI0037F84EDA
MRIVTAALLGIAATLLGLAAMAAPAQAAISSPAAFPCFFNAEPTLGTPAIPPGCTTS